MFLKEREAQQTERYEQRLHITCTHCTPHSTAITDQCWKEAWNMNFLRLTVLAAAFLRARLRASNFSRNSSVCMLYHNYARRTHEGVGETLLMKKAGCMWDSHQVPVALESGHGGRRSLFRQPGHAPLPLLDGRESRSLVRWGPVPVQHTVSTQGVSTA